MVNITKVYTRTGDKGTTMLAGGQRVAKTSPRIQAFGSIDELNALLGLTIAAIPATTQFNHLQQQCLRIQNELFDLGAQLAILPADRRSNSPQISSSDCEQLEQEIDKMNATLPALSSFILPGGTELVARFHVARTVCRRAERDLAALIRLEEIEEVLLAYLNRLSDWLFVAARYATFLLQQNELLWQPHKRDF